MRARLTAGHVQLSLKAYLLLSCSFKAELGAGNTEQRVQNPDCFRPICAQIWAEPPQRHNIRPHLFICLFVDVTCLLIYPSLYFLMS